MIYLKCIIVGIAALVIAAMLFPVVGILLYTLIARPPADVAIGFDPVSAVKSPTVWLIALIVFAVGFYWELHRLRKQTST
jgi:hypothetical protein